MKPSLHYASQSAADTSRIIHGSKNSGEFRCVPIEWHWMCNKITIIWIFKNLVYFSIIPRWSHCAMNRKATPVPSTVGRLMHWIREYFQIWQLCFFFGNFTLSICLTDLFDALKLKSKLKKLFWQVRRQLKWQQP